MEKVLVVLAAGMGSRYGGLKQLEPVGPRGEILLDYSVRDAVSAGFAKVVFVIRRDMAGIFHETVGARYEHEVPLVYAFQELEPLPGGRVSPPGRTKPWGTGHAVLAALPAVKGPFAVINADDYYGPRGFSELSRFLSSAAPGEYAMVGYRLGNTLSDHGAVSRGICRTDAMGFLIDITERTEIVRTGGAIVARGTPPVALTGEEWASMNFWGFTPDVFPALERSFEEFLERLDTDSPDVASKAEFYLPAAISGMIATGESTVRLLRSEDPWFGLTYPEDKPVVASALAELERG